MSTKFAPLPKHITALWLWEHYACPDQIQVFKSEWPNGAYLTEENLLRAAQLGLDLDWFAVQIFDRPAMEIYKAARERAWDARIHAKTSVLAAREAYASALVKAMISAVKLVQEEHRHDRND